MGIAIAIGNRIGNGSSGGWTPKSIESKLLYWGKISEITGGTMPNKVGTDHIDIGGSAGTYTFQVPNTAPYIAADTDYIWFKTDASQRTTTEAELVGYDLQRTPVKYLDGSPNSIQEILIFKLGETLIASERDHLVTYMHLPVMWDNSLSVYGYVKSNRGATQQLWTPELLAINYDTFTDSNNTLLQNHTMDVGSGWTVINGDWQIQGNALAELTNPVGVTTYEAKIIDEIVSDFDLSIDLVMLYGLDIRM
jgi:hypothetical protein